jgi:hypothetical protein
MSRDITEMSRRRRARADKKAGSSIGHALEAWRAEMDAAQAILRAMVPTVAEYAEPTRH